MVPAITMLVDSHEHLPYEFERLVRIAGTFGKRCRREIMPLQKRLKIFCVERRRVEEFNTIFSNPSSNRSPFLQELELLMEYPHRFLVIEGTTPVQ